MGQFGLQRPVLLIITLPSLDLFLVGHNQVVELLVPVAELLHEQLDLLSLLVDDVLLDVHGRCLQTGITSESCR